MIRLGVKEDWVDKKLAELIAAGINPFIELDIADLAEGDPWSAHFPGRKIYGNLVEGIRGIQRNAINDTIHYEHNGFATTAGKTAYDNFLMNQQTNIQTLNTYEALWKEWGQPGGNTIAGGGSIADDNYELVTTAMTLSSGAISNQEVLGATAARYGCILWGVLNANTVADYTLAFHAAGGAVTRIVTCGTTAGTVPLGGKFLLGLVHGAVNVAIQVDVAGGGGAEELYLMTTQTAAPVF